MHRPGGAFTDTPKIVHPGSVTHALNETEEIRSHEAHHERDQHEGHEGSCDAIARRLATFGQSPRPTAGNWTAALERSPALDTLRGGELPPRPTDVIETQNLTRRFGARTAVDGLTISVPRGKIVGFLGPNGAGKSTTLKMLAAYLPPSEGTARVGGCDVVEDSLGARRLIGYMPETVPLHPEMRVGEYLRFRAEIKGVTKNLRASLDRALELADITDVQRRLIGDLSKGYRQRVGLADALVAAPPLLILDEPTEGLDPNQILRFREVVRQLGREHTVFLSTHILQEVEAVCEEVIILHQGRLAAQGPLDRVRAELEGKGRAFVLTAAARAHREFDIAAALRDAITRVDGAKVEAIDPRGSQQVVRFTLPAEGEVDAALDVVIDACAALGLGVRGLAPQSSSLEAVFHALTTAAAPTSKGAEP